MFYSGDYIQGFVINVMHSVKKYFKQTTSENSHACNACINFQISCSRKCRYNLAVRILTTVGSKRWLGMERDAIALKLGK